MKYYAINCPDREFYLSLAHTKNDIICEFLSSFEGCIAYRGLTKLPKEYRELWNFYKKGGYKVFEVKLGVLR